MEMTPPASISRLGSEFDDFLFALIGEDRNGLPLSVVSVLARMDLDPWQEAARLAALPAETAARKLAAWLDALPDPTLKQASSGTLAVRLIALLPHRTNPNIGPPAAAVCVVSAAHPRTLINAILVAIYMILALGIQFVVARRDSPVRTDTVHAPAPPTVPSPTLPTTSGN